VEVGPLLEKKIIIINYMYNAIDNRSTNAFTSPAPGWVVI